MEAKEYVVGLARPILAVGHHTAFIAEQGVTGCEACSEFASMPFEHVVLELSGYGPFEASCILPQANECPRCNAAIVEATLVCRGAERKSRRNLIGLRQTLQ